MSWTLKRERKVNRWKTLKVDSKKVQGKGGNGDSPAWICRSKTVRKEGQGLFQL